MDDRKLYNFMKFISDSALILDGIAIGIAYLFTADKVDCYLLFCICDFTLFFHNFLKLVYRDPRPYMINNEISSETCSTEYGNPSGHSMLTI